MRLPATLLLLSLCLPVNSRAEESRPVRVLAEQELKEVQPLEGLLGEIRSKRKLPALGCVVVLSNRVVAIGVSGVRKTGVSELVRVDDKWHLGSVTKSMTASLAAILVADGKLRWNTTLGEVFKAAAPSMHADWRGVTLEQLLGHRGGAPGGLEADGLWGELWGFEGTPLESRRLMLEKLTAKPPASKPGSKFEYSNAGVSLAGHMIETVCVTPWEELITQRLFLPLGMTNAGFGVPATPRYINQPWGHTVKFTGLKAVPPGVDADNPPAIGPAGTVHASLMDLARYGAWHLAAARGEPCGLPAEIAGHLSTALAGQEYALGWNVLERPWGGGKVMNHTGSNTMWFCNVWLAPQKSFAVFVVCNAAGSGVFEATDEVASAMINKFLPAPEK